VVPEIAQIVGTALIRKRTFQATEFSITMSMSYCRVLTLGGENFGELIALRIELIALRIEMSPICCARIAASVPKKGDATRRRGMTAAIAPTTLRRQ
jgi:hypothetical protein